MVGKEEVKPVAVLVVTCLVWGALLGLTHGATEKRIEEAERAELYRTLSQIFPSAQFTEENGYYVCSENGVVVGYAVEVEERGYGGKMRVLVGVLPEGTVAGVRILSHGETPGLGAKVTEEAFLGQFRGKGLEGMALKKDGGEIEGVTGATISSRAVVRAVRSGLENLRGRTG
jgi:electron transport complex protein RnfG